MESMVTKKSERGITTIQLSYEVREKLKERGKKGQTYEEIILELLKIAEECEKRG